MPSDLFRGSKGGPRPPSVLRQAQHEVGGLCRLSACSIGYPSAAHSPPPVPKVSLRHERGGRTERHGLSSPIATLISAADRRAKSDGVPRWGCLVAKAALHPHPMRPAT